MTIKLISCIDLDYNIGSSNKLLAHMPSDLAHFKKHTEGNIVIMGRKTLESIIEQTGKILPNRINIVLTKNKKYEAPPGVFVYHSVKDVLQEYSHYSDDMTLYIAGGGEIYKEFLPYADEIILTILEHKFDNSDTKFPSIPMEKWKIVEKEYKELDERNPYNYAHVTFRRK